MSASLAHTEHEICEAAAAGGGSAVVGARVESSGCGSSHCVVIPGYDPSMSVRWARYGHTRGCVPTCGSVVRVEDRTRGHVLRARVSPNPIQDANGHGCEQCLARVQIGCMSAVRLFRMVPAASASTTPFARRIFVTSFHIRCRDRDARPVRSTRAPAAKPRMTSSLSLSS